jgi:hypothetical protein
MVIVDTPSRDTVPLNPVLQHENLQANAGEDKIVFLPQKTVVLNGNQSSDDHAIGTIKSSLNVLLVVVYT